MSIHCTVAKELVAFSVSVKSQKIFLLHSSQKNLENNLISYLCFLFRHFGMIFLFFMRQIFLKVDLDDNR